MRIRGIDGNQHLNLNLIPEDYIRDRIRRRNNLHQRRTAALFLVIILVCSWTLVERSRKISVERDDTVLSVGRITNQLRDPVTTSSDLEKLESKASLITCLRLRGFPSQVFHMLERTRPDDLLFTTLKLSHSEVSDKSQRPELVDAQRLSSIPSSSGISRDLEQIRRELGVRRQGIQIEGEAPDDLSVADFLGKLRRDPLCADVKLDFTDHLEGSDSHPSRRFAVKVRLKSPLELLNEQLPDNRDVAVAHDRKSTSDHPLRTTQSVGRREIR